MITILHILASLVLCWSCFDRLHQTSVDTCFGIRGAFWLLGAVALVAAAAPFYGFQPDMMHVALIAVMSLVQGVTSKLWEKGVPDQFQKHDRLCGRH